jgi:formate-dependent nitrite reductase membrane component NrfD
MGMCPKCGKITAILFIVLALVFLSVDLGKWEFWNVSWWTALFAVWGITLFGKTSCKDCQKR